MHPVLWSSIRKPKDASDSEHGVKNIVASECNAVALT